MSSTECECCVCHKLHSSVLELHYHQMQTHTSEELSYSIINLQGLRVLHNPQFMEDARLSLGPEKDDPTKADDDRNNNMHINIEEPSDARRHDNGKSDSLVKQGTEETRSEEGFYPDHSKTNCLVNCSLFIPLEQELNKHLKVNDRDFLRSTIGLCNELQSLKEKRRKRKPTGVKTKVEVKNEADDSTMESSLREEPIDSAVKISYTSETSKTEALNTSSNENTNPHRSALSLIEKGLQENVLLYGPANKKSWDGISGMDPDLKELVTNNDGSNLAALIFASNTFQIGCMEEPDPSERNSY